MFVGQFRRFSRNFVTSVRIVGGKGWKIDIFRAWSPVKKTLDNVVPMTAEQQATRNATQLAADAKPVPIKESPYFDSGAYKSGILSRTTTPFGPVGSATQEAGWSPLAKRGDPRAAAELQRRGRTVIFTPDNDTPLYMDSDKFADLLRKLQQD